MLRWTEKNMYYLLHHNVLDIRILNYRNEGEDFVFFFCSLGQKQYKFAINYAMSILRIIQF